jgi:zinc D-Ala-D-Ala carboxypeptidase
VGQSHFRRISFDAEDTLNDLYRKLHTELGISADYGQASSLPFYPESTELVEVGPNLVGRMQSLTPIAAQAWRGMVRGGASEGIQLMIVSGYRSFDYQADLIRRKIAAGQVIDEILTVNAAPGFSQHHTGAAIDIASPGSRPLTEEFEISAAFSWLKENAATFGFSMTYPRDNAFGFIYEPWHWAHDSENRAETA